MRKSLIIIPLVTICVVFLVFSSSISIGNHYLDFRVNDKLNSDVDPKFSNQFFAGRNADNSLLLTKVRSYNNIKTKPEKEFANINVKNSLFKDTLITSISGLDDIREYKIYRKDLNGVEKVNSFNSSATSRITSFSASKNNMILGFMKASLAKEDDYKQVPHIALLNSEGNLKNSFSVKSRPESVTKGPKDSIFMVSNEKVFKYSNKGELLWEKKLGYPDIRPVNSEIDSIIHVNNGNIYVGSTVSNGRHSIAVSKFSLTGERTWSTEKDYPGVKEKLNSMVISDEGVYISGSVFTNNSDYGSNALITKLSTKEGETLWDKTLDLKKASKEIKNKLALGADGRVKLVSTTTVISKLKPSFKTGKRNILTKYSSEGKELEMLKTREKGDEQIFFADGEPYILENSRVKSLSKISKPNSIRWDIDLPLGLFGTNEYYETSFYQKKTENSASYLKKINNTEMNLSVTSSQGQTVLNIENTGKRTIRGSEFELRYAPPEYPPVEYSVIVSKEYMVGKNKCLEKGQSIEPGEQFSCKTGLKYPIEDTSLEVISEDIPVEKMIKVN